MNIYLVRMTWLAAAFLAALCCPNVTTGQLPFNYRLEYAQAPSELPFGIEVLRINEVVRVNNGTNDGLYVIGNYRLVGGDNRGFIYHYETSEFIDMPTLLGLAAPDFIRCGCYDMNESGIVVASIRYPDNLLHGVYFDLFEPGTPQVHSLHDQFPEMPPPSELGDAFPYRINAGGDMLMAYWNLVVNPFTNMAYTIPVAPESAINYGISDGGTVIGQSGGMYRYNIHDSNSLQFLPFVNLSGDQGINNFDEICALQEVSGGRPRNQINRYAVRYSSQVDWSSNPLQALSVESINDSGDICGETPNFDTDVFLHYSNGAATETGPTVRLQTLITDPFFASGSLYRNRLTERVTLSPTLSAPIVCGQVKVGTEIRMYFLIPQAPPNALVLTSIDTPKSIPDYPNTTGATSTITVVPDVTITNLSVTLNISHARMSDLQATLIGPDNTTVPLPNLTGVNDVGNFDGTLSAGNWRVKVVDSVRKQTGTLNSWTLTIEY